MIRFSLNRPVTILMLAIGLCLLGVISWQQLPVQLLPEIILPEVFISGGIAGASPEKIERDLMIPIEAEVATLEGVHDLESSAFANFGNVRVSFNHGTDMKFALLKLQQKMSNLQNRLPQESRIEINRFDTADLSSFLMQLSLRGDADTDVLREFAERRIRPRIERIDGIVNVNIGGGRQSNISIAIDADRCEAMGIPVAVVQQKINAFHRESEHLGKVMAAGRRYEVNMIGRVDDVHELKSLIIEPRIPARLGDVARVERSHAERTQFFRVNGKSGVGINVQKDNQSNMLAVANSVLSEIERLNNELKAYEYEIVVNFSQAELVQQAIDRVKRLALTGALLALLVLYLFLRNLRFVSILMIAIPVSLLVTFNFMYAWGLSVNVLSLCGLALAIGMLVDNGIVVMESIFAHFQRGKHARAAAEIGTREVSRSIFAATTTTILVFVPVLFVESDAQLFVHDLALSVIFPLAVSLVVALTLVPLLASRALAGNAFRNYGTKRLTEIYRLLLKAAIRHRIRTITIVLVALVLSLFVGVTYIISQAPSPPPGRLDVYLTMPRGVTLDATDQIVRSVEAQVLELPDIKETRANIREEEAQIALSFVEPNERTVPLKLDKIKTQLAEFGDRSRNVDITFDRPRAGGGSGGENQLTNLIANDQKLRLRGQDVAMLRQLSEQIQETLRAMPEVSRRSVRTELREGSPELQIRGDRLKLAHWGLDMQRIMQAIWATRAEGTSAATPFFSSAGELDIQTQMSNADERQLEDVGSLKITNQAGPFVPLNEVASISIGEGPGNIVRFNQERQVQISFEFTAEAQSAKSRLENASGQIDRMIQEMRLPRGFTLEKVAEENQHVVYYWMIAIGAILIFMFLAAQFESVFSPFVILGTVPTAMIGALLILALSGTPLSLGQGAPMALLGLIVLLGIVVNNGIILVDRIAILRSQYGFRWQRAVIEAGQSRVRPILMTSATTALGIFPLALKQGTEFELWPPFAITVLGGLVVSSVSTLIFLPVLYVALEQTKAWLKSIGWLGLVLGTLLSSSLIFWFHESVQSWLYTCLLVLPVWFGILGVIYGMQRFRYVQQEKAAVAREEMRIQIRNLSKTYGAPGRFVREWNKYQRRMIRLVHQKQLPWTVAEVRESTIWLAAIGAVLIYLHTFIENQLWLLVLSVVSLIWAFALRALWYQLRFALERPPRAKRRIKLFSRKKSGEQSKTVRGDHEEITPLSFSKRGAVAMFLVFVAYLQLRIQLPGLTAAMFIIGLLIFQLNRIARRIERGAINPELPAGKLRRLKRLIYTIVRNAPVIRPPNPQVIALQGVNLEIGRGMFGLLGPNGAGKTTLMRSIVGVLEPDRGTIKINGRKLEEHREAFHGSIGYLPQDFGLYENMTPLEALEHHALTNGIYERETRQQRIHAILENVGLWERRDDKIKTFSGGMKQRVGVAQTLLHLPQIIVVDEPTAGLDPRERIRFRNLLAELSKDRIVIFSTHIVEDISSTCHELAVLNRGEVVYRGSPEELQEQARGKVYEAYIDEDEFSQWNARINIVQHSKQGDRIRIRFVSETTSPGLAATPVDPSLEDAYVLLLNRNK